MKKLLFVLAIGSFAACNNAAETSTGAEMKIDAAADKAKEEVKEVADSLKANLDSTTVVVDSTKVEHNHAH